MAHSPLSAPGLLAEPSLREVAGRHGRSPAQVVLRWNLQRGLVPLPSSVDPAHIAENLRIDFELDADAMAAVDSLSR
jgi:diketogulonate reductase-like aldo/keto reductase